jgi:acyl dehydratase
MTESANPKATVIGRTYPATEPYEVGREKIREFADAIGDQNPAYRDRSAAQKLGHPDVVAPPTFPIIFTMRSSGAAVLDPELALDFSRIVHGEQQFTYERPVYAGDRLVCVTTIENLISRAGNEILTTRTDVTTEEGEPVLVGRATIVARGTAKETR